MSKANDRLKPIVIDIKDIPLDGAVFEKTVSPQSLDLPSCEEIKDGEAGFCSDVNLYFKVTFVGDSYEVDIDIETVAVLSCVRCLGYFEYKIETKSHSAEYDEFAKEREIAPGKIDMASEVHDEILLALPDYPHCKPDCKGICSGCGADLNKTSCICHKIDI